MNLLPVKKIWTDPVWSKVIAAGIIAAFVWVGEHFGLWFTPWPVPGWLLGLVGLFIFALATLLYYNRTKLRKAWDELEELKQKVAQLEEKLTAENLSCAQLTIDCSGVPGNKDETPDDIYLRFRLRNDSERHVAKGCRPYLVELHKISNNKIVSDNLIADTFQLPWAGWDFEPRDIPYKVNQYVDLVHFSKHIPGWIIATKPGFPPSLMPLAGHRGTYRFTVMVACDGATPQAKNIYADYNGDWKSATPYE